MIPIHAGPGLAIAIEVPTPDQIRYDAWNALLGGGTYPIDSPDSEPSKDWMHAAARGVIASLPQPLRSQIAAMPLAERAALIDLAARTVQAAIFAWFCAPPNEFF